MEDEKILNNKEVIKNRKHNSENIPSFNDRTYLVQHAHKFLINWKNSLSIVASGSTGQTNLWTLRPMLTTAVYSTPL